MLVRLLYASRAVSGFDAEGLTVIVRQSRQTNIEQGVTGLLCYSGGIFLQVLEGSRSAVNHLYGHIAADKRHTQVELLSYAEIEERRFAGWSMGQVDLDRLNPALLLKYFERAVLDPYAITGRSAMAFLEELVATNSIAHCG